MTSKTSKTSARKAAKKEFSLWNTRLALVLKSAAMFEEKAANPETDSREAKACAHYAKEARALAEEYLTKTSELAKAL